MRQNLAGQGLANSGEVQTWNYANAGPSFGVMDISLRNPLEWGVSNWGEVNNYSYGGTSNGQPILYLWPQDNTTGRTVFIVAELEVFTFQPVPISTVPDAAGTVGLLGLAFLGIVSFRRRIS